MKGRPGIGRIGLSRMMLLLCLTALSSVPLVIEPSRAASIATRIPCGLCEEADRFVRLQTWLEESSPQHVVRYSHPVRLDPEDWTRLLRRIRVQSRTEGFLFGTTKGSIIEAFTDEEIQFLAMALNKAFAEARPEEVVVFGLARARTAELTEITTGSWFVTGDTLHLVLPNYRTAVTLPGIRALLWREPLRTQPGLHYELVPGDYQAVEQDKGEAHSLFESSQPSQVDIQYRAIMRAGIPAGTSSAAPTLPPGSANTLEERLARVKRLWEAGMITEEEYRVKKQELLDRL